MFETLDPFTDFPEPLRHEVERRLPHWRMTAWAPLECRATWTRADGHVNDVLLPIGCCVEQAIENTVVWLEVADELTPIGSPRAMYRRVERRLRKHPRLQFLWAATVGRAVWRLWPVAT